MSTESEKPTEPVAAEPPPVTPTPPPPSPATPTSPASPAAPPRPPRRWGDLSGNSRIGVIVAGALVLACLCGGAGVAIGVVVGRVGHHVVQRDDRRDGPHRPYGRRDDNGGPRHRLPVRPINPTPSPSAS